MKKHFLSTPLVIATMAFAIVAFLFLIDTSINQGVSSSIPSFFTFQKGKDKNVACTLEAKQCPDGSFVGRSGPNCAFADCPAANANAVTNQNLNTSDELIAGRDLYINKELGFSFQYPVTFGEFTPSSNDAGYRGQEIATAGGDNGIISIAVKDETYDPNTITGTYGQVEKQYIRAVNFGSRAGSMFMEGDAGCGAQIALTSLATSKTLSIAFGDCVEDPLENDNTAAVSFFNDTELIKSILATFVFTD